LATGAFSVGHEAVASASQLIRQLEASTKLRLQQRGGRVLPGTAALDRFLRQNWPERRG